LPVLYNGNSSSLGFLGDQTPKIVLFYNQIDVIQQARVRLRKDIDIILARLHASHHPISDEQLALVVNDLLAACKTAVSFLPSLKTGTSLDDNDGVFPEKVGALIEEWQRVNPGIKVS